MSNDVDAVDDESDNLSDFGCAEGKPPRSLKQNEFSLKQFAQYIEQANYSTFNKWKKVWLAGFFEEKHISIIQGNTYLKQLGD
jgi:hypothetical protein